MSSTTSEMKRCKFACGWHFMDSEQLAEHEAQCTFADSPPGSDTPPPEAAP
jgi:hypothetical protein